MTVTANGAGVATGQFVIPPNTPPGAKRIEIVGGSGTRGEAIFVTEGNIQVNTLRRVVTVRLERYDPIAQTFTLDEDCSVSAVDLTFLTKPTSPVVVSLNPTVAGMPEREAMVAAVIQPASIQTNQWTTISFPAPIELRRDVEYALVVACNDTDGGVAVGALGEWDVNSAAPTFVSKQPYQPGVLLASSNNSTWTPIQDADLSLRLRRATFTSNTRTVTLGTCTLTNATDLIVLPVEEVISDGCAVEYQIDLPGGQKVRCQGNQPVQLGAPVSGTATLKAILTGTTKAGPVVHPGAQLVTGTIATSGTYISKAITAGTNVELTVVYDGLLPSGAGITVNYKGVDAGDTWQSVPYVSQKPAADGFVEFTHKVTGVNESLVHVRLTLTGSAAARPQAQDLRVIVK